MVCSWEIERLDKGRRSGTQWYSPRYASRDILHRACPELGWFAGAIRSSETFCEA